MSLLILSLTQLRIAVNAINLGEVLPRSIGLIKRLKNHIIIYIFIYHLYAIIVGDSFIHEVIRKCIDIV